MNSTEHKTNETAFGRPAIIIGLGVGGVGGGEGEGGFYRFYGMPTFTLIFRRGLHDLVGCFARMELSYLINVSSRATIKIKIQRLETLWDPWGVSNTTETLEQKKITSWTPIGQETDKCLAPINQIVSFVLGLHSFWAPTHRHAFKRTAKLLTVIGITTLMDYRAMSIDPDIWQLKIVRKTVTPSHFHDNIEIGNIWYMLERKSSSDLQSCEVFDDILFDYKTENHGFVLHHLKY